MNYPDDIRRYDHDPRSPFYDDWRERAEERARANIPDVLDEQCARLGLSLECEVEAEEDEDGASLVHTYTLDGFPVDPMDFVEIAAGLACLDRESATLPEQVEACIP